MGLPAGSVEAAPLRRWWGLRWRFLDLPLAARRQGVDRLTVSADGDAGCSVACIVLTAHTEPGGWGLREPDGGRIIAP